jgi:hypothetical protein
MAKPAAAQQSANKFGFRVIDDWTNPILGDRSLGYLTISVIK